MARVALQILGGLAGLTQGLRQEQERKRAEELQLLGLLGQQGYSIEPATQVQAAPFIQRLMGQQYAPQGGSPVVAFGGQALTARRPARFSIDTLVNQGLEPDERRELVQLLQPYANQPLISQTAKEIALTQRDFWKGVHTRRREREKEIRSLKTSMLGEIKGAPRSKLLSQQIRSATTVDELLALYPQLPSDVQKKVAEHKALAPLPVGRKACRNPRPDASAGRKGTA